MKKSLSIIVPVYNSEQSLPILISCLVKILPELSDQYEVILVNDGSQDRSWEVIEHLCKQHAFLQGIDLVRNFGQHNALLCGIRAAKYEIIITMDDDLQHPPEEIRKLLLKLDDGYDVAYGTPIEETHGYFRNISSRLVKWSLKIAVRIPYAEKISAFRAFRTSLRELFTSYSNTYVSIDILLSWGTGRIGFVEVKHTERTLGKSQYTFSKLMQHMYNMVLGFSVVPLRIASILGLMFTLFGFFLLAFVLLRYFAQGGSVPGFSFLASTVAIFSGIILFVLGIIGEYLARMYINLMAKPPYLVSRQIGKHHE